MPEEFENKSERPRQQSFFETLPKFPGDARDASSTPLPNRAKAWGKYGLIWGAFCGIVAGIFVIALSLFRGYPPLGEAVGILFGAPVVFGLMGGIAGRIRGSLRDFLMDSRDHEKQRGTERREDENRDWHGMQQILRRNQDDT